MAGEHTIMIEWRECRRDVDLLGDGANEQQDR